MGDFISKYLEKYKKRSLAIYDIGSQDFNGGYRSFFKEPKWKYFGVDIEKGNNVNIVLKNFYNWREIASNSADVVISGQALEHIEYPWKTMSEIARIMKYGAIGCIIVPSSGPEHKSPLDCWRFFPDGLRALAKYSGLDVVETYNCWYDTRIDKEENIWKDTVLIFTKKKMGIINTAKIKLRNLFFKIL